VVGRTGFRSEFNSTALAELRFHCAAEFCVCLAIFWLTWSTSGTARHPLVASHAARRRVAHRIVLLTKIDGARRDATRRDATRHDASRRDAPPSIYRSRHASWFSAIICCGRADITSLILRDKSARIGCPCYS